MELEDYEEPPGVEKQNLVKIEDLENHFESMKISGALLDQYKTLESGRQKPCVCAEKTENKKKNRYSHSLPYDDNRIVLERYKDDSHSDYINASYIENYYKRRAFICTQGPMENTLGDFWRMIWQEDVAVIVMTANIVESGSKNCEKYWPDKSHKYDDVQVQLQNDQYFLDYTVRSFRIQKSGSSVWRNVLQYQYTAWLEHDVPQNSVPLLKMLKEVEDYQQQCQKQSPVVLHCSDGIGRSGTVLLLLLAIQMAKEEKKVDIISLLYRIRQQRVCLVETEEQFLFVYRCLIDWLFGDKTCQDSDALVLYFNKLRRQDFESKKTGLQNQFEILERLKVTSGNDRFETAASDMNRIKNRDQEILPPDDGRPILKADPPNNYINAVYVHDYAKVNQYIATQYPMSNTVEDFWQLVYDLNCTVVVVLNEISSKDKTCDVFWPSLECTSSYGKFKIQHLQADSEYLNGVLTRKLKLKSSNAPFGSRKVRFFQVHGWSMDTEVPPRIEFLVHLYLVVQKAMKKYPNKPAVIACYNGNTASGFFCALSVLAGQIANSQKFDVFHAVRTVRANRPTFITSVEQYRWLYEAACFLSTNNHLLQYL